MLTLQVVTSPSFMHELLPKLKTKILIYHPICCDIVNFTVPFQEMRPIVVISQYSVYSATIISYNQDQSLGLIHTVPYLFVSVFADEKQCLFTLLRF